MLRVFVGQLIRCLPLYKKELQKETLMQNGREWELKRRPPPKKKNSYRVKKKDKEDKRDALSTKCASFWLEDRNTSSSRFGGGEGKAMNALFKKKSGGVCAIS